MTDSIDAPLPNPVEASVPDAPVPEPIVEPAEPPAPRFGVFFRDGQRFAIPIDCVVEVVPGQPLTRVPRATSEVAGLLNLRGEIVTVLLVDTWLDRPQKEQDPTRPILVLCQDENLFGIEVDRVEGVLGIPEDEMSAALPGDRHPLRAGCAGWWQPDNHPPCVILAGNAFRDLICPLDVSDDP